MFHCVNIANLTCLAVIKSCKCADFQQNISIEQSEDTFDIKKKVVIIGGTAIKWFVWRSQNPGFYLDRRSKQEKRNLIRNRVNFIPNEQN